MSLHKQSAEQLTPAAFVHRGQGIEAVHCAAIAIVDADSRLTHALGDPDAVYFARSSIKPLQALALVEAGGLTRFRFDDEQLALCAASHHGSDRHRAIVQSMLERLGFDASALQCGAGYPADLKQRGVFPLAGEDKDPLRHNCSGKHCGFLALAKLLEQPLETYLDPSGAAQTRVRAAIAQRCEVSPDSLLLGVDGCSAPNYALSLRSLAIGFKNLAAEPGACAQVRAAMLAHPALISGERALDCELSRAFPGRLLVKGGAEAMLLMALRDPPIGIAIKIIDGAPRALAPIAIEVLKQLAVIDSIAQVSSLERFEAPVVFNARKLRTGEIRADFKLQPR